MSHSRTSAACQVVQLELQALGMSVEFEPLSIECGEDATG